ncbi:MAG: hypothetical protein WC057_07245 [Dehalococcoidales bacterium]|jgi:hypothetical protein
MNIGKIIVSESLMLDWLKYEGGHIRAIVTPFNSDANFGTIEIIIEHPDMPELKEGYPVGVVTPSYVTDYPSMKVTRVKS